jgi:hypothetical protein
MHSFALPSLRKSTAQIQLQLNSPTDSGEDPYFRGVTLDR